MCMEFKSKNCKIKYSVEDGVVIIENLEVAKKYRGQGFAKQGLTEFLKKNMGRRIEGHCYPQDNETSLDRLLEFYKSFGFKVGSGDDNYGWEIFRA
jgi:ribosomal protein S18 acetylase RimI-like enzyme